MQDWYDKKVHTQSFNVGDEVYLLNLRLYQGKCPKWLRRYSDTAIVTQKLSGVTYVVKGDGWKTERVVHVDKLKLKSSVVDNINPEKQPDEENTSVEH
jgi:hypothetical protein